METTNHFQQELAMLRETTRNGLNDGISGTRKKMASEIFSVQFRCTVSDGSSVLRSVSPKSSPNFYWIFSSVL